jgi:hypothetical protein
MAKLIIMDASERQSVLDKLPKDVNRLAGGLSLPIGTHEFLTGTDPKSTFGLLNVDARDGKKWALPIAAGTVTVEGTGEKIGFVLSDKPNAKTLVIPENIFMDLQCNTNYKIGVEMRGNNKRITSVVPADVAETVEA